VGGVGLLDSTSRRNIRKEESPNKVKNAERKNRSGTLGKKETSHTEFTTRLKKTEEKRTLEQVTPNIQEKGKRKP